MTAGGIDPRRLCQISIPVRDVNRALAFYEGVFGWRRVPADIHELVVLEVPADCPFGIALVPTPGEGSAGGGPVLYFAVANPDELVRQVESLGGRRRFGPASLAGYGRIWQVEDPDGNRWGLFLETSTQAPERRDREPTP